MPLTPEEIKAIAIRSASSVIDRRLLGNAPPKGEETPREKALRADGEAITLQIDNGVTYRGPWLPNGPEGELLGHLFQDDASTKTSFVCQDVEDCKKQLVKVRKNFDVDPPVFMRQESPREYWDKYLEHNPLRTMPDGQDTNAGAFLSNHLEGAGDILREFSHTEYIDRNYIFEKFNRFKNNLDFRDWKDPLSATEIQKVDETKILLAGLPVEDEFGQFLKDIMFDTLNRDRQAIRDKLPEFRKLIEDKLNKTSASYTKKEAEPPVFTKQENVKPCPNLLPMAEWIKGETPGTCRPCTLTPVVQWYWSELKERGFEKIAAELEAEVEVLEEDNVEQVMAICRDLDKIKKAAPEDLRKRLEEFDCAIQSFDPAEVSGEEPTAG
ncbi:MAG: hypothetical protein Q8O55_07645 [Dehalococcoidales bacterium]|nr:hypothetical protein [Dehalococcoidales bacterium]